MEIQVFCPIAVYPAFFGPRSFSYVAADPSYSPPGVTAHYLEYPALPLISRPLNGVVCAKKVMPHLERFRPDLILSYYVYPEGYAALSAGKRLSVPVILGAIGSDINRIPDRISAFLTRKALREASFVLTVSEHLRDQAIRLGASAERSRTGGRWWILYWKSAEEVWPKRRQRPEPKPPRRRLKRYADD